MFSRSNNSLWNIYLSFHVPSLCALCNTLTLAWVTLPHTDRCMLATWSRDWEDPVGNILALDEVAAREERTVTYKVPSAPTYISCSSDILTTSRAVYALFSHVIKNKSSVTCSQRSVFICSRSTEMERPPQLAAHHLVSWSSFGTPKPNSSWRKLNRNTHPACDFQPPIRIQSIGSGQRWGRVKPHKLPPYGCEAPGSDLAWGRGSRGGSSSRARSSHPAFTPGTRREGARRLFTTPEQHLASWPGFRLSPSSRDTPRFPCTSLFPGQKNLPLAEANSHGRFLDLYTPQQDSSDDCERYYIFFLIAFLLQAFLVEIVFRQERIQNGRKALCRAASPWMLHFYFWEVSFRFEETQEILCSWYILILHWLSKNTSAESL